VNGISSEELMDCWEASGCRHDAAVLSRLWASVPAGMLVGAPVELPIAGEDEPVTSGARGPDPAGLAAFTLDSRGRVACWPAAAVVVM
jgi:hypothetical protein